ncbi:MAG TPA: hypothetical protein VGI40_21450 [Pirellulaceae bacterium]|jgi:hypothetical protein
MRAALFLWGAKLFSCVALSLIPSGWTVAQQDSAGVPASSYTSLEPAPQPVERPAHLFVARISANVLSQQFNRRVDRTVPVRDVVLGTPVSGAARIVGQPQVELVPCSNEARFNMVFSGTVYSRTAGYAGPATVYGHSITYFKATKEVVFEPGKGFQALPSKIAATTHCYTDDIAPSRGGLIGRIVQRRASEEVAAQHPQITAIARQRAVRRIEAAFDREMASRIAHLNQSVDFQIQLASGRTREGCRKLMACTTPNYLQIADMIYEGNETAVQLPTRSPPTGAAAPIEVWVHNSLIPPKIAKELKSVFSNPDHSATVNVLALLPGILGKEAAAAITAFAAEQKIGLDNVGDWLVIDVNGAAQPVTQIGVASRNVGAPVADRR